MRCWKESDMETTGIAAKPVVKANMGVNRPFPSSKESHFQNEAKCETFVVKMRNICIIIENHFHINGFALSLALKVRFFGIRKWPIGRCGALQFSSCWAWYLVKESGLKYFSR